MRIALWKQANVTNARLNEAAYGVDSALANGAKLRDFFSKSLQMDLNKVLAALAQLNRKP